MKKYILIPLLILLLVSFKSSDKTITIFIAGDSTAQSYNQEKDGLIKGWGQMLPALLDDKVRVVNHAMGGRSTKTFISEGRWQKLLLEVTAGDYVFIQFGHNDASTRPERHASYEDYRNNLIKMIEDVRAKNATPVLLTSVAMRTFDKGNLVDDRLKGYPVITRQVANQYGVALIDINLKTRDFITLLGDEDSKPYYRWVEPGIDHVKPEGLKDDTHTMEKGAKQVALFVAEGIGELKLKGLSQHLKIANDASVYLFSYFKGNGDGLHLAYSRDGIKWEALNADSVYLKPLLGKDKLMRDPSIVQDDEGVFHLVWTTGWWDKGIGYAWSKDLKNWSEQINIPVMEKFEGAKNAWAPELFYDKKDKTFYVFWASTIPGAFADLPTADNEKGLNHRQYYIRTKDFKTVSDTKLFFEPGFSVIDGATLEKDGIYYLFIKNENSNPPEKNIRVTTNDKPYDFPTEVSQAITGNYWAEGAAPLQVGDYVYVYFDKYREHTYGAVRSKDMKHWQDVSDSISFPTGTRHGTAFSVSERVFNTLIPSGK